MTFDPRARLRYDFTDDEKVAIWKVLAKMGFANPMISRIRSAVTDDGWTSLPADEALMLAGLLLPWYEFLSARIVEHPGIFQETGG